MSLTDPSGMAPEGGGLDSSDPLPANADASSYYEKNGVVYVAFLRKDGNKSWRPIQGAQTVADFRPSLRDGSNRGDRHLYWPFFDGFLSFYVLLPKMTIFLEIMGMSAMTPL